MGDAVDEGLFFELVVSGEGEGEVAWLGAHGADVAEGGGDELPAEVCGVEFAGDVSGAGHGVDVEDESVGEDGGVVLSGADGEVVGGAAFEDGAEEFLLVGRSPGVGGGFVASGAQAGVPRGA